MSLIAFHRVLITAGILFAGSFSAWQIRRFLEDGAALHVLLAAGFGAATVGLIWYLLNLDRFLGRSPGG